MTQRFFVYPLLFVVLMQLVPLLRRDARWFAAQIVQLVLILLACLGAMYFVEDFIWVVIAWTLFAVLLLAPKWLAYLSAQRELRGQWKRAARLRHWAGNLTWGELGTVYRAHAAALRCVARAERQQAEALLEKLAAQPMPESVRGAVRLWMLSLLLSWREWEAAVEFYERVRDWGTLALATQARLLAARAFAETGQMERALSSLQFVVLSPRSLGVRWRQLWMTRVSIAALAGDRQGLEELLGQQEGGRGKRGFARFAAYWRGRCALARGEREEAVRQLARAYALTHPHSSLWREAIMRHLRGAEAGELPTAYAAQQDSYARGQQNLRMAEEQTVAWRALMHMGQAGRITLALLVVMGVAYVAAELFLSGELQEQFWLWAGNGPETVSHNQWWRVFTALFLHANLLHLAMNGAALWIFGSAVERAMGRWRFLLLFFVAGAAGNSISAAAARYDIAVGASAAIFGVVGAFAVAVYRLDAPMYMSVRRRLLMLLGLVVAADFAIGGMEPQVDNLAHVGGFVAGIALAMALRGPRR